MKKKQPNLQKKLNLTKTKSNKISAAN